MSAHALSACLAGVLGGLAGHAHAAEPKESAEWRLSGLGIHLDLAVRNAGSDARAVGGGRIAVVFGHRAAYATHDHFAIEPWFSVMSPDRDTAFGLSVRVTTFALGRMVAGASLGVGIGHRPQNQADWSWHGLVEAGWQGTFEVCDHASVGADFRARLGVQLDTASAIILRDYILGPIVRVQF